MMKEYVRKAEVVEAWQYNTRAKEMPSCVIEMPRALSSPAKHYAVTRNGRMEELYDGYWVVFSKRSVEIYNDEQFKSRFLLPRAIKKPRK